MKMSSTEPCISADHGPKLTDVEASTQLKVIMKHVKCVQLDKDNYYSWETQFSMILHGFQLMYYVKGDIDLTLPMILNPTRLVDPQLDLNGNLAFDYSAGGLL